MAGTPLKKWLWEVCIKHFYCNRLYVVALDGAGDFDYACMVRSSQPECIELCYIKSLGIT